MMAAPTSHRTWRLLTLLLLASIHSQGLAYTTSGGTDRWHRHAREWDFTITIHRPLLPSSSPSAAPTEPISAPGDDDDETSEAPTQTPTSEATTEATVQVDPPTSAPPTEAPPRRIPSFAPTRVPSGALTAMPLESSTVVVTTLEPSISPTSLRPTVKPTSLPDLGRSVTPHPSVTSSPHVSAVLVSEVQAIRNKALFSIKFSLWSSQIDPINLQTRVLRSLGRLFCKASDSGQDADQDVCALQEELLNGITTKDVQTETRQAIDQESLLGIEDADATTMYLSVEDVVEKKATVNGGSLSWSEWEISWLVTQLGASLTEKVILEQRANETNDGGRSLDAMEVYHAAVAGLEEAITQHMNKSIMDGRFDHLISTVTYESSLVVSTIVGNEAEAFEPFVGSAPGPMPIVASEQTPGSAEGDEKSQMYIVLFFAGLGVGFVVVLGLLYFACKPKLDDLRDTTTRNNKDGRSDLVDSTEGHETTSTQEEGSGLGVDTIIVIDSNDSVNGGDQSSLGRLSLDDNDARSIDDLSSYHPNGAMSIATDSVGSRVESGVWSVPALNTHW